MKGKVSPDKWRIVTFLERRFTLQKHVDVVHSPEGRAFSLVGFGRINNRDGQWVRSENSVDDRPGNLSDLSTAQWRALFSACFGDESTEEWRKRSWGSAVPNVIERP